MNTANPPGDAQQPSQMPDAENQPTEPETTGSPSVTGSPSLASLKGLKGVEYRKAWNKLYREKCRQAELAWRKRNPDKVKELRKKRRNLDFRGSGNGKKRYYSGWESASMRCERWGVVEDCMVMDRKANDRELAKQLGRSISAIQIRRNRLTKQNLEESMAPK